MSPPLLIVYSLFNRSYILDLQAGNSFVEHLLNAGFDVYLLDFGIPDERDAGNTLDDYADEYLPAAVERVRQVAQEEQVNMLGYCFGGLKRADGGAVKDLNDFPHVDPDQWEEQREIIEEAFYFALEGLQRASGNAADKEYRTVRKAA